MLQDKFKIKIRQQGAIATPYHQIVGPIRNPARIARLEEGV
jgi:hypothetical protein